MNRNLKSIGLVVGLLVVLPSLAVGGDSHWIKSDSLARIENPRGLAQAQLHSRVEEVAQSLLGAAAGELRALRSHTDELGQTHVRMQQFLHGKRVYGADTVLHVRPSGDVYLLNGMYADSRGAAVRARLTADEALAQAIDEAGIEKFEILDTPKLVYVVGGPRDTIHLAWRALVAYEGERAARDYVFADAVNGRLAVIYPTIHYAKSWETFDAQDAAYNSGAMPGALACTDSQSCVPTKAQDAHDGASDTYDYYLTKFGGIRSTTPASPCARASASAASTTPAAAAGTTPHGSDLSDPTGRWCTATATESSSLLWPEIST